VLTPPDRKPRTAIRRIACGIGFVTELLIAHGMYEMGFMLASGVFVVFAIILLLGVLLPLEAK